MRVPIVGLTIIALTVPAQSARKDLTDEPLDTFKTS